MRRIDIDRNLWLRGERPGVLARAPSMCPIGHYLAACGTPPEEMEEVGDVSELPLKAVREEARWLFGSCIKHLSDEEQSIGGWALSDDYLDLVEANDSPDRNDAWIERRVRRIFRKHGVDVRFSGPRRDSSESCDEPEQMEYNEENGEESAGGAERASGEGPAEGGDVG